VDRNPQQDARAWGWRCRVDGCIDQRVATFSFSGKELLHGGFGVRQLMTACACHDQER